jgi:hypothetical protein
MCKCPYLSLFSNVLKRFANKIRKRFYTKKRGAPPCFGPAAQLPFPLSSLAQPNRAQPISNRFFFLQLEVARCHWGGRPMPPPRPVGRDRSRRPSSAYKGPVPPSGTLAPFLPLPGPLSRAHVQAPAQHRHGRRLSPPLGAAPASSELAPSSASPPSSSPPAESPRDALNRRHSPPIPRRTCEPPP